LTSWTVALVAVRCRVPRRLFSPPQCHTFKQRDVLKGMEPGLGLRWTGGRKAGDRPRGSTPYPYPGWGCVRWTLDGTGPRTRGQEKGKGTGQGTDPLGDLQVCSGGSRSLFFFTSPRPLFPRPPRRRPERPPCRSTLLGGDPIRASCCSQHRMLAWGLGTSFNSGCLFLRHTSDGQEASSLSGGPSHIHTDAQHPTPAQHNLAGLRW
jgi:hypothetical protein